MIPGIMGVFGQVGGAESEGRASKCIFSLPKNDIGRALLATMDLFRLLAVEAAEKMNFTYPDHADKNATQWVKHSFINLFGCDI